MAALQSHYATKAELVDAFVASVIEFHGQRLDVAMASGDGHDKFVEALRYIVAANANDANAVEGRHALQLGRT